MEMTGTNIPLTPEAVNAEVIKPEVENPLERPDGRNKLELVKYYVMFPLYFVSIYTIPGKTKILLTPTGKKYTFSLKMKNF